MLRNKHHHHHVECIAECGTHADWQRKLNDFCMDTKHTQTHTNDDLRNEIWFDVLIIR